MSRTSTGSSPTSAPSPRPYADNSYLRNPFFTDETLPRGPAESSIDRTFSQARSRQHSLALGRRQPLVHPREGWQGHGMPRRRFLQGGMGLSALAALGAGGLLSGCASDLTRSGQLPLPRR